MVVVHVAVDVRRIWRVVSPEWESAFASCLLCRRPFPTRHPPLGPLMRTNNLTAPLLMRPKPQPQPARVDRAEVSDEVALRLLPAQLSVTMTTLMTMTTTMMTTTSPLPKLLVVHLSLLALPGQRELARSDLL